MHNHTNCSGNRKKKKAEKSKLSRGTFILMNRLSFVKYVGGHSNRWREISKGKRERRGIRGEIWGGAEIEHHRGVLLGRRWGGNLKKGDAGGFRGVSFHTGNKVNLDRYRLAGDGKRNRTKKGGGERRSMSLQVGPKSRHRYGKALWRGGEKNLKTRRGVTLVVN